MKIKFVPRNEVRSSRKVKSKYQPLKDAISKLEPGGKAIQASYSNEKELISLRNIVYTYNRENDASVKTNTDSNNNLIFFYIEK
ncbi:MAG: hypothetical protein ACNA78_02455 [Balneolaceae bacterium]